MSTYSLAAQSRETFGHKNEKMREQGFVPAVLYGHGIVNQNIFINKKDFVTIHDQAGANSFVDLMIEKQKPIKTLIYDLQHNPLTNEIIHVDFYQINEDEKITTEISLDFQGEAPAVKELGGVLVKNYDEVEIECLPKDLEKIKDITVDLSSLKTYDDAIHIKDLQVPAGIKILTEADEVVVMVSEPKEEEEEKPVVAEVAAEEVKGATTEQATAGEEKKPEKTNK